MGGSCAARLRCFRHPWGDGRISDAFRRQRHAALSRGTGSAVRAALGARFYPKEPDSVLYPAACGACHCCDRAGRGPLRTLDRLRLCAGRLRSGDHRDGGDALRQGEPLSSGGRAADTRQRSLHRRGACDPLHGILGVPDRRVLPGADAGLLLPAALRMLPFDRGGLRRGHCGRTGGGAGRTAAASGRLLCVRSGSRGFRSAGPGGELCFHVRRRGAGAVGPTAAIPRRRAAGPRMRRRRGALSPHTGRDGAEAGPHTQ